MKFLRQATNSCVRPQRCYCRIISISNGRASWPSTGGDYERAPYFGSLTVVLMALAALGSDAVGQQKTLKELLVGTWTSVSVVETTADGTKIDRWGPHAKGISCWMQTATMHY